MTSRDPSKKSKKRSASNSTSNKQPEPPLTVFVDECLGRIKVPAALRAAGVDVKILEDEFQAGTPFKPVLNTTYLRWRVTRTLCVVVAVLGLTSVAAVGQSKPDLDADGHMEVECRKVKIHS